ncbi:MAG: hypothetical protein ACHQF2_06040 [Flavobacteriales bacterium]
MKTLWYSLLIWASTIISGSLLTAACQQRFSFPEGLTLALVFSSIYGSLSWYAFFVFYSLFMDGKIKKSNAVKMIICTLLVPVLVFMGFLIFGQFMGIMDVFEDKLLRTAFISYVITGMISMSLWTYIYLRNKPLTVQ